MGYRSEIQSATAKTQAAGAFALDIPARYQSMGRHQIQVEVSATPSAGTLTVTVKTPGAASYQAVDDNAIDLTGTLKPLLLDGEVESITFTPASFDADKTYSVYLISVGQ